MGDAVSKVLELLIDGQEKEGQSPVQTPSMITLSLICRHNVKRHHC